MTFSSPPKAESGNLPAMCMYSFRCRAVSPPITKNSTYIYRHPYIRKWMGFSEIVFNLMDGLVVYIKHTTLYWDRFKYRSL